MSLSQDDYSKSRIVKQENFGQYFISTVRLPEAYRFELEGRKSWTLGKYETMISLNGEWLDYQERCDTLKQAKIQHQEALLWVMLK